MKLALAAAALLMALVTVGIACGPKETFCYKEGKTCRLVAAEDALPVTQPDADADAMMFCPDPITGNLVPCSG